MRHNGAALNRIGLAALEACSVPDVPLQGKEVLTMVASRRQRSLASSLVAVFACSLLLVLLLAGSATAVKRGAESVNCGGGESQSTSYRAHDTIGQCPIGPVGQGGGMRIYDGFWLVLPSINVPVEGAVYAVLSDEGAPLIRWSVSSLDGVMGFNVYRSTSQEGPYEVLNDAPLEVTSWSFVDETTWPETTFWYEVRVVFGNGSEEAVKGSPASVTTEGHLSLKLYALRPNPTSGASHIVYDVPRRAGALRLCIYNVRGQRVAVLVDGPIQRGRYETAWDGNDESGRPVASGVYFVRLDAGGKQDGQKVMVLH
jgi:hypothetical protein